MEHSIITLEPTVNSNSYDNKIRTPSISPPVRPSESPKYKSKKRQPLPFINGKKSLLNDKHVFDDLDLLGHYGNLGNNPLPIIDHPNDSVQHIADEYRSKLKHPYFSDWH